MKYLKAEVELIVLENVDIITSSPHKCPKSPGSDGCAVNGETYCNFTNSAIADWGCFITNTKVCTMKAGPNSFDDPTESM